MFVQKSETKLHKLSADCANSLKAEEFKLARMYLAALLGLSRCRRITQTGAFASKTCRRMRDISGLGPENRRGRSSTSVMCTPGELFRPSFNDIGKPSRLPCD